MIAERPDTRENSLAQTNRIPVLAVILALIALGISLRLAQYLHGIPLWLDEAALALNIIEKPLREIAGPLTWHQNSPLAFLFVVKTISLLLGTGEFSLRLFPLLSGLASVPIFCLLARDVAGPVPFAGKARQGLLDFPRDGRIALILIAVAFFAVNKHLIYYSNELRHYSTDVLLTCLIILMAGRVFSAPRNEPIRKSDIVALCITGLVATWFSLAAIFVLGSVALTAMLWSVLHKDKRRLLVAVIIGVVWVLNFLPHRNIHQANVDLRNLQPEITWMWAFWQPPLPPRSVADLKWYRDSFEFLFYMPAGLTYRGLGGFAFLAGCISLWYRKRDYFFLLTTPIVIAFAASALALYPFGERYILFLTPCFVLLIAEGVAMFFNKKVVRSRTIGVLLLTLLLAQPFFHGLKVFAHPRGGFHIPVVMEYLAEHWDEGDGLYLPVRTVPPFLYYQDRYPFGEDKHKDFVFEPMPDSILEDFEANMALFRDEQLPALLARTHSVWLIYLHDSGPPISTKVGSEDDIGLLVDVKHAGGAALYRYAGATWERN